MTALGDGYDHLNEPLPNHWQHVYGQDLMALYAELTATIREVDPHHLVMYEGVHWSTDFSAFAEPLDPNSALHFHRYWCPPDRESISHFLEVRDRLQVPIYMGEGGENTPEWLYAAFRLLERHDISWNFWPWKKLDTTTSPLSIRLPERWNLISDPASPDPGPDEAWTILESYLAGMSPEHCDARSSVTDALFARGSLRLPAWSGSEVDDAGPASRVLATAPPSIWAHGGGQPYNADEFSLADAPRGRRLLALCSRRRPASWTLGADDSEALTSRWVEAGSS